MNGMTKEELQWLLLILGLPAALLSAWMIFMMLITPLVMEWLRKKWAKELGMLHEAHETAVAARDTGEAFMAAMQAQGNALAEAIRVLGMAHDTAKAFGELRSTVNELKAEVDVIKETLSDIRGYMRGAGMDKRTSDRR